MKRALPAKRSAPVCYLRSNRQAGELGRLLLFMCLEQADNANDQDPDLNQISKLHPRWTRANTLSSGKKSALDIVIVLGGRQPRPKGTGLGRPGGRCQATPPSSSSSPAPIFARWKVLRSFSGAEIVSGEADEAGGPSPANEENEAGRGFRPEKPCPPLSIEGTPLSAPLSKRIWGQRSASRKVRGPTACRSSTAPGKAYHKNQINVRFHRNHA